MPTNPHKHYKGIVFAILLMSWFSTFTGRLHNSCTVTVCACESEATSLHRHGLWPLSPTSPKTAVSENLLQFMHTLMLEAHMSLSSFVDTLKRQGTTMCEQVCLEKEADYLH